MFIKLLKWLYNYYVSLNVVENFNIIKFTQIGLHEEIITVWMIKISNTHFYKYV